MASEPDNAGGKTVEFLSWLFSLILAILTFPISIFICTKVIAEFERAVIFRMGRIRTGARGPGVFFVLPCIDDYFKVDLRTVMFDVPPQDILTKDSVTLSVDAVVYYRISDPVKAVSEVENYRSCTHLLATTTLRNVLVFGLDSPLLFPPGMDPAKIYNPLMEMSDPRGMHPDHHGPFLKKKMTRPKGQHSAPRGGPPRSWTNAELTEALQHVWNKKMTTSQASRIFGIPYNSLLMYVRGKYGKSLKLEQLRKDCISGPPIELLTMGMGAHNNNNKMDRNKELKELDGGPLQRSSSSEPDLLSSPNAMFNPFPPGFYPDFSGGFPGLPLSMLNLLPPDRHPPSMHMPMDEDCKSDRSKQSLEDDFPQPLTLTRDERREILQQNGQD